MNYKGIITVLVILLLSYSHSIAQVKYYQYSKSVKKDKLDLDLITEFEIGFHTGCNWTIGSASKIARSGQVYSLNLGWNNGRFYGGTEFNLKFWDEVLNKDKANKLNFNRKQFLCLLHAKWYVCKGKVQPFLGVGTDFLSLAETIINPKEEEEDYRQHDNDNFLNYNAWFVPALGIRSKLRSNLFADLTFSLDHSDHYDSMRLQLGISYQPQF